ncbi:MAG: sporulation protein YabP [Desulfocucumaceae bacterium]
MDQPVSQKLALIDRKQLELEGVLHVGSFDEREIVLDTTMGILFLKGEGLHIIKLNLDEGTLSVQGYISSLEYKEGKSVRGKGKSMLSRIMK